MSLVIPIQKIINDTTHEISLLKEQNKYTTETAKNVVAEAIEKINNVNENNAFQPESLRIRVRNPFRGPIIIPNIPVPDIPVPDIPLPNIPSPEEMARILEEELKRATKNKLTEAAQSAIDSLRSNIPDPAETALKMVAEIESLKDQVENLLEELNPIVLINKALDKGEVVCEEYINSKMVPVLSPINLKGLSDVEFILNGTKISAGLTLYLVLADFEGDFQNHFILNIASNVEVDVVNPMVPNPFPNPVVSQGNLYEQMKNTIDQHTQAILAGLTTAIIDSYFPAFTVINKFKDLLKL